MPGPLDFLLGKGKQTPSAGQDDASDLRNTVDPRNSRALRTVSTYDGVGGGDIGGRIESSSADEVEADASLNDLMRSCGYLGDTEVPEDQLIQSASARLRNTRGF